MALHDLHIGDFCKDAARTLLLLYRRFPVKTTLYIEDIAGPDQPDEFGLHSPRHMAAFGAALWLAEEGLFRFSQPIKQEALDEAVLSAKAMLFFSGGQDESRIALLERVHASQDSIELNRLILEQLEGFKRFYR